MRLLGPEKVVVLGMMSRAPVAGVAWQVVHYMVGLERLGFEPYYVEAHARTPTMLMRTPDQDGSGIAADYIAGVMNRFGFDHRWAFHALHADGRCYGMSRRQLMELYDSAAVLLNLHGGTFPRPEHTKTGRLVYLETDPVQLQFELAEGNRTTIEFLDQHVAHFTFAENYGHDDCRLPVTSQFDFRPTRQPVVLDFWRHEDAAVPHRFTTIGNWQQRWRDIAIAGDVYTWSKDHQFRKILDVPGLTDQIFELALSTCPPSDLELLSRHGWHTRDGLEVSGDVDVYRTYIRKSWGEFTVAKDQNVRLRTGWFSDRSATYLSAGRPVITQDTGFGNILPTGAGLFAFSRVDEILDAVDNIKSDYAKHSQAAGEIAHEYFAAHRVLRELMGDFGSEVRSGSSGHDTGEDLSDEALPFPESLDLLPRSKKPLVLAEETIRTVLSRERTRKPLRDSQASPQISVVVVTYNKLTLNVLCLESLLAEDGTSLEVVIVDNGSSDGTTEYLASLREQCTEVTVIFNEANRGFAAAVNQGLAACRGEVLVILNNDTIVNPGWIRRLSAHLQDESVGMVSPVTNSSGDAAEVHADYRTYGELHRFARERMHRFEGQARDVDMLTMFCVAMPSDVFNEIGPLDERFELAMFEDDDYARRLRAAGYRLAIAEDAFVHHFGGATLGDLVPSGEFARLLSANRHRFEEKWGIEWRPRQTRDEPSYIHLIEKIQGLVERITPAGATIAVVSRGDDRLISFRQRSGWHFPRLEDGTYAGYYPEHDGEAIDHLEQVRSDGADFLVIPETSRWWLTHYHRFDRHLNNNYPLVAADEKWLIFGLRDGARSGCG